MTINKCTIQTRNIIINTLSSFLIVAFVLWELYPWLTKSNTDASLFFHYITYIISLLPILLLTIDPIKSISIKYIRRRIFPFLFAIFSSLIVTTNIFVTSKTTVSLLAFCIIISGFFVLALIPFFIWKSKPPIPSRLQVRDILTYIYGDSIFFIGIIIVSRINNLPIENFTHIYNLRFIAWWIGFLPLFLVIGYRRDLPNDYWGLTFSFKLKNIGWMLLCSAIAITGVALAKYSINMSRIIEFKLIQAPTISLTFFFVAFQEEFIFRGGIMLLISLIIYRSNTTQNKAAFWAILMSSLIFGITHYSPSRPFILLPLTFYLGLCWGWLYYKTHNIFLCVISHTILNSILGS